MRISSEDIIGGYPIKSIRDFLRKRGEWSISAELLSDYFKINQRDAGKLFRCLLKEGFLEVDCESTNGSRVIAAISDKGLRLRSARLLKPFSREQGEKLLSEFLERVREVNSSDDFLEEITKVSVFGSYLTDAPDLGDLDLCVETKIKDKFIDNFSELNFQQYRVSSMTLSRMYIPFFSYEKMMRFIKNRSPRYSFHDHSELKTLHKKNGIPFKVIYQKQD